MTSEASKRGLKPEPCSNFEAVPGKGIKGTRNSDNAELIIGTLAFLKEQGVTAPDNDRGIHAAINKKYLGSLELIDPPKPEAEKTLTDLKERGLDCILLTGDSKEAALEFAKTVPLTDVKYRLLPEDKLALVRQAQHEGKIVAMTGDGLNDAPALSQADISISHYKGAGAAQSASKILLT